MRSQRCFLVLLLAGCGVLAMAGVGAAQSVADNNLLWGTGVSGITVGASSQLSVPYQAANSVNGLSGGDDKDFVFAPGDGSQRLVVSGINSAVSTVRVWTGGDIPVNVAGVWSSTTATTAVPGFSGYNPSSPSVWSPNVNLTYLDSSSAMGSWTPTSTGYYRDFTVNAPAGTQSLLFNFGATHGPGTDANYGPGFARVQEVQAFSGYKKEINLDVDGYNTHLDGNSNPVVEPAPVTYTGAGVAGGGVWNSYAVYSPDGNNVTPAQSGNLLYSNGTTSGIKFALSSCNPDNQHDHSGGFNALMDDYVAVGTGSDPVTFTLSGLNINSKYSLYLYGQASTWAGCATTYNIQGAAKSTSGAAAFDGLFGEGRDFVKFNVKCTADGTIQGTVSAAAAAGILNGLQLVEEGYDPAIFQSNLLSNKPVAASSQLRTEYQAANAVNGADGGAGEGKDLVFDAGDGHQRLIVHGLDGSSVGLIRVWTSGDIPPLQVLIKSSVSDQSDVDSFTGTTLVENTPLAGGWQSSLNGLWYRDFIVNALAGTQSLFFDFGGGNGGNGINNNNAGFARICEVQAFAAVPEPAAIVLLCAGLMGLVVYAWRKRR